MLRFKVFYIIHTGNLTTIIITFRFIKFIGLFMVLILGRGIPSYNRFIRSTMHTTILKKKNNQGFKFKKRQNIVNDNKVCTVLSFPGVYFV